MDGEQIDLGIQIGELKAGLDEVVNLHNELKASHEELKSSHDLLVEQCANLRDRQYELSEKVEGVLAVPEVLPEAPETPDEKLPDEITKIDSSEVSNKKGKEKRKGATFLW
jgi:predicted  nucleic acid-binding Zn-ribbon protein